MSSNDHFPPQELPRLHKNGGLPAAQLLTLVASSFPFALIPISIVTTYLYSLFRKKLRTLRRRRVMPSSSDDVIPEGTQSIHSNTDSTHGPGRRKSSPAFETLDETNQYPQEYGQADEGTSPEQVQPPPPPPPLAPLEPPDDELTGTTQFQYTIPKPAPVKRLVEMPPAVVLHKSRKLMSRGQSPGQSPGQSQTQNRVGFSRMEDSGSGSGSGLQWKNESFFKLSPITDIESSRWEFHPENFKFLSNEFLNSNPRSSSRFGHKPAVSLTGITVISPFESNPFLMRAVLSNDIDNDGGGRDDDNDVGNGMSELNSPVISSPPAPQSRNLPYILPIVGTTRSKENQNRSFPIPRAEIGVMTQVSSSSPTRKVTMAMTSRSTGFETEKQPPIYANKSSSSPKFQDFSGRRQVLVKIKDAPAQVPSPPPTTSQSRVSSPWAWNPSPPSFCPVETNQTQSQSQSKGHYKSIKNLNEKLSRKSMFVEFSAYPPEKRRKDAKSVGIATLPILQSSMASETVRPSTLVSKASSVSGISKKEMKSATTDGVQVERNFQTENYLQNIDTMTTADNDNVKSVGSDLADRLRAQGTGEEHVGPVGTNSRQTDTEEILLDDKSTQVYKLAMIPPPISVPLAVSAQNLPAERLDVGNETDKIQKEDAQEQNQVDLQAEKGTIAQLEQGQGQTPHVYSSSVSTNSSSTNTEISKREVEGQVTPPQQSEKGQMSESYVGSKLANLQQCSLPLLSIVPEPDKQEEEDDEGKKEQAFVDIGLASLELKLEKVKEIDPDSEKEEQDQVEEDEEDAENTPEDPWDFSPHVYTTESGCKQDTGTEIEGKQEEEAELEAKHFKLPKATDSMLILLSSPNGEESGEQKEIETGRINTLENKEQVMEPCSMRNGELIDKDKISRAAKSLTQFLLASYPSSQLTSICTSKSTHCLDHHHDTGTTTAKPTKTLATNTLVNCDDGSTDRKYEKSRLLDDQSILSMRMKRLRDDKNAMLDKTAGILAYFSLEKSCVQMKLHPPLNGEQPSSYASGSNYNSRNNHSVNTNYPLALDCEKLIISPCDCISKSEAKPKVKLKASEVDKNAKVCNNESLQQPQGQSSTSNNYKSYYDYLKNRRNKSVKNR